jgi:hypothetical protein
MREDTVVRRGFDAAGERHDAVDVPLLWREPPGGVLAYAAVAL